MKFSVVSLEADSLERGSKGYRYIASDRKNTKKPQALKHAVTYQNKFNATRLNFHSLLGIIFILKYTLRMRDKRECLSSQTRFINILHRIFRTFSTNISSFS